MAHKKDYFFVLPFFFLSAFDLSLLKRENHSAFDLGFKSGIAPMMIAF